MPHAPHTTLPLCCSRLPFSGKWEAVHGLLEAMLPPEEAASLAADWQASSGGGGSWGWEQDVLLHHPGRYPARAICPAQLLLLPPCASGGSAAGSAGDGVQAMDVETPASAATATGGLQAAEAMQACLWVHPAAAAAAHSALRLAAAQQEQQASGPGDVGLAVLDLRRLELRGGGADAALAAAMAGATAGGVQQQLAGQRFEEQQAQAARQPAQQAQPAAQQGPGRAAPGLLLPLPSPLAQMQHGDAVQVLLADPSLRRPVQLGSAAGSLLPGIPAGGEQGQAACPTLAEQPGDLACLPRAPLPLSEAEISSLRHQLRRRMLQLDPAAALGSGGSGAADAADPEVQRRAACPAVLVRHDPPGTGGIPGEAVAVMVWTCACTEHTIAALDLSACPLFLAAGSQPELRSTLPLQQAAASQHRPNRCCTSSCPQAGPSSCRPAGRHPCGSRLPTPAASRRGSASGAGCTPWSSDAASLGTGLTRRATPP